MNMSHHEPVSVEMFSGAEKGVSPGACGLFSILGNCDLPSAMAAARVLQYRARNGAGVFLKGLYRHDDHYHLHIMFRDAKKIKEYEEILQRAGLNVLEKRPLVKDSLYFEYDMPVVFAYTILTPSEDVIQHRGGKKDLHTFIRDLVSNFNMRYKDDVRIFSSSLYGANFTTAFELEDTIRIFDLEQYSDSTLTGVMVHMRWPTSQGQGLWWGAQPIAHGNVIGIHNGHLSSDKSNARALEELGIALQVGTDSEAIFQETYWSLTHGFSIEEIEWTLSQKFPVEAGNLSPEKKELYNRLTRDPVLRHFKMSGPSTAVVNVENLMIGLTDRDHMRQFTVGYNDKLAVFGSEERAIMTYAALTGIDLHVVSPPAGKAIAFLAEEAEKTIDGYKSVKRLDDDFIFKPAEREKRKERFLTRQAS